MVLTSFACSEEKAERPGRPSLPFVARDASVPDARDESCAFRSPSVGESIAVETFTELQPFLARLEGCVRTIDFDDIPTSSTAPPASFLPDRYVDRGVRIEGEGGQYVHPDFGYPDNFAPAESLPNSYAPGPISHDLSLEGPGGFHTQLTFFARSGARTFAARVAGVGAWFIDTDYSNHAQTGIAISGAEQGRLGFIGDEQGENGNHLFRGIVTVEATSGDPVSAIFQAEVVNGTGWVGLGPNDEIVSVDDLKVSQPIPL